MIKLSVSTTLMDSDGYQLVSDVYDAINTGVIKAELGCVLCTRDFGDDPYTDSALLQLQETIGSAVPIVRVSAKKLGRIGNNTPEGRRIFDEAALAAMYREVGYIPEHNCHIGDMLIRGRAWCDVISGSNLHPDLPRKLGGFSGEYWKVIGQWVKLRRREIGAMMHLIVPDEADVGNTLARFHLPAFGIVNGVNLNDLWEAVPTDAQEFDRLIQNQVRLRDKLTDPLFKALREAECRYESTLVIKMLQRLADGEIHIDEGRVFGRAGHELPYGYDLTSYIVGDTAIWPRGEGSGRSRSTETQ